MNQDGSVRIVGLDVGGANLKACSLSGARGSDARVRRAAFAVWKHAERLREALAELLLGMPEHDVLAVTMTAELCDCFETKRAGVAAVLDAVETAAAGRRVLVWQTGGRFVELDEARVSWVQTAAANWLALATYAGRFAPRGTGLLIDVGSTTTDMVPLCDGVPAPQGRTDPERLASGELVYSGVRRTPVCALVREVPWRGRPCAVAAEWFATTQDVYLVLGDLAENENDRSTADGRPATRSRARERLARVVCGDREMLTRDEVSAIAEAVAAAQMRRLGAALERVTERLGGLPETVFVAGEGEWLARRIVERTWGDAGRPNVVSLAHELGTTVSQAACAYAVAALAQDEVKGFEAPPRIWPSSAPLGRREAAPVVIKVGGSLLHLNDLPERLRRFLGNRTGERQLLVVGGGRAADAVRELDRRHRLGDDSAHWLAVRAMGFNACLLEATLREARVVTELAAAEKCWADGVLPILDPSRPLQRAERDAACASAAAGTLLPHRWDVTSDSIAAWVATRIGAKELVLLKSAPLDRSVSLEEAIELGLVDGYFRRACAELATITYVTLRSPDFSAITLEHRLASRKGV